MDRGQLFKSAEACTFLMDGQVLETAWELHDPLFLLVTFLRSQSPTTENVVLLAS